MSPKYFEGTFFKLKLFLKSPANALSRFPLKMYHPESSYLKALLLFIASSVIAALLFITAKENVISRSRQPKMWDFHILQIKMLVMLNSQLFQITH